ncbi:MAG: Holliday junction ATP-dependent DNA helicase RuvA [Pelotomaculum sp. PtaU1.Bin035]|nr:MAG: Holliday junction ATP-dependent DNA helicase RuvA [Pelotomaculum sp. PtaU1.Bin035]
MIVKISGTYTGLSQRGVLLDVKDITYEVYLTAFSRDHFQLKKIGERISLYTMYYIESNLAGGHMTPTLVGFDDELEKEFFQLFTSVAKVGVKTALAAITVPVPTIARAIECSDVYTLKSLKGIGERTAKKIIAALHGKVANFALVSVEDKNAGGIQAESGIEDEATQVLLQLGYNLNEAKKMVGEAVSKNSDIGTAEELLEEIYKNRANSSQKR